MTTCTASIAAASSAWFPLAWRGSRPPPALHLAPPFFFPVFHHLRLKKPHTSSHGKGMPSTNSCRSEAKTPGNSDKLALRPFLLCLQARTDMVKQVFCGRPFLSPVSIARASCQVAVCFCACATLRDRPRCLICVIIIIHHLRERPRSALCFSLGFV